ncbi:hypothetical protein [Sphingomonas sp. R86521]|uniref:hypothetical protein n=1 Tax=Sphingomonas sp. R86521 TaxID=3093860 RepID=UPI0036D24099
MIAWLVSVAVCIALLIRTSRYGIGLIVRRATGAVVGAMVLLVAIALVLRALSIQPTHGVSTALFQMLFTIVVTAMLTAINRIFHGMVDAQIAFHTRYNAANLRRFPISVLIGHARQLKLFGTTMWCFGSALMLYGVWFDMTV